MADVQLRRLLQLLESFLFPLWDSLRDALPPPAFFARHCSRLCCLMKSTVLDEIDSNYTASLLLAILLSPSRLSAAIRTGRRSNSRGVLLP